MSVINLLSTLYQSFRHGRRLLSVNSGSVYKLIKVFILSLSLVFTANPYSYMSDNEVSLNNLHAVIERTCSHLQRKRGAYYRSLGGHILWTKSYIRLSMQMSLGSC